MTSQRLEEIAGRARVNRARDVGFALFIAAMLALSLGTIVNATRISQADAPPTYAAGV